MNDTEPSPSAETTGPMAEQPASGRVAPAHSRTAEAQWLAQIAARGPDARAALQHLHSGYQRAFLAHFKLRGLSVEDALDATQDLWLDVFRKAGNYRPEAGSPYSWLWGFAHTALTAALSRRKLQADRFVATNVDADGSIPSASNAEMDAAMLAVLHAARAESPLAHELLHNQALRLCVERAFEQLARQHPEESCLLYAVHMEGFDAEDVAQRRGSTMNATYVYLSTARKRLKAFLQPCWQLLKG